VAGRDRTGHETDGESPEAAAAPIAPAAARPPHESVLELQREHGNAAVGRMLQRWYIPNFRAAAEQADESQRNEVLKRVAGIGREKVSRADKQLRIGGLINDLPADERRRLATDAEFIRGLRRRLSATLAAGVVSGLEAVAEGREFPLGEVTVLTGPLAYLEEPDEQAADLFAELLSSQRIPELRTLADTADRAEKLVDMVARGSGDAHVDQVGRQLRLIKNIATVADPESLQKWLKQLSDDPVRGMADLLQRATEILQDTLELVAARAESIARRMGNKTAAIGLSQLKQLELVGKGIGTAAAAFESLTGLVKMVGGSGEERLEGGVDFVGHGGEAASGVFEILAFAAERSGDFAKAARLGAMATRLLAGGLAVQIVYEEVKFAARLYGASVHATSAPAVKRALDMIEQDLNAVAKAHLGCKHWFEQLMAAGTGDDKLAQLRAEMAQERLAESLSVLQQALKTVFDDIGYLRYETIRSRYHGLKDRHAYSAMADPRPDPSSVYFGASRLAEELLSITAKLYGERAEVHEGCAREDATRFGSGGPGL